MIIHGSYIANVIIKKKNVFEFLIDEINYGIDTKGFYYENIRSVMDMPVYWRPIAGVSLPESITANLMDKNNEICGTVFKAPNSGG